MRLKLTVAYDGTAFRGWARQPGERTVEGVLTEALDERLRSADGLAVAGRTDTGVHALANVVSVDVDGGPPPERAAEALNAVLPPDRRRRAAEEAPAGLPRPPSARSRSYRYRIWRRRERSPFEVNRSLWHPRPLDRAAAGRRLRRCWSASTTSARSRRPTPSTTSSSRVVEDARWHDRGDTVEFEITADSFLRHMVRTLVGTMLELDPDEIVPLLQGAAALGRRLDGRSRWGSISSASGTTT